jgi:hypothetical protein
VFSSRDGFSPLFVTSPLMFSLFLQQLNILYRRTPRMLGRTLMVVLSSLPYSYASPAPPLRHLTKPLPSQAQVYMLVPECGQVPFAILSYGLQDLSTLLLGHSWSRTNLNEATSSSSLPLFPGDCKSSLSWHSWSKLGPHPFLSYQLPTGELLGPLSFSHTPWHIVLFCTRLLLRSY